MASSRACTQRHISALQSQTCALRRHFEARGRPCVSRGVRACSPPEAQICSPGLSMAAGAHSNSWTPQEAEAPRVWRSASRPSGNLAPCWCPFGLSRPRTASGLARPASLVLRHGFVRLSTCATAQAPGQADRPNGQSGSRACSSRSCRMAIREVRHEPACSLRPGVAERRSCGRQHGSLSCAACRHCREKRTRSNPAPGLLEPLPWPQPRPQSQPQIQPQLIAAVNSHER